MAANRGQVAGIRRSTVAVLAVRTALDYRVTDVGLILHVVHLERAGALVGSSQTRRQAVPVPDEDCQPERGRYRVTLHGTGSPGCLAPDKRR